jgi:hypothetical protein
MENEIAKLKNPRQPRAAAYDRYMEYEEVCTLRPV